MKRSAIIALVIIIMILGAGLWYFYTGKFSTSQAPSSQTAAGRKIINQVSYSCDNGKAVNADFYQGASTSPSPKAGEPPVPTGSVKIILSDGRQFDLPQTISGSGIRYANKNESVIFWGEGNSAYLLENNTETYSGCIVVAPNLGGLSQVYASSAKGFSIRYPAGYTVNASYKYQALGPEKSISGVKFVIPSSIATGTNLSSYDTGVSVEEIPLSNAQNCNATPFVYPGTSIKNITDNNVQYSFATTSNPGAGNFYDEEVWAMPDTNPCMAVRYLIHSTDILNYPAGTVRPFNRTALLSQFNQIRRSLVLARQ